MPVYFVRLGPNGDIKIGFAVDVLKRIKGMQTGHSSQLIITRVLEGGPEVEAALHERFKALRLRGEWFTYDPAMAAPDIGYQDLPVPLHQPRGRGRPSYSGLGPYRSLLLSVIERLGGRVELGKRLGIPPWDNALDTEPWFHFSAIALLAKEAGHSDVTYQRLRDLYRDHLIEKDSGEKRQQREVRVEKELSFIRRNGRDALWWDISPETDAALANLAKAAKGDVA